MPIPPTIVAVDVGYSTTKLSCGATKVASLFDSLAVPAPAHGVLNAEGTRPPNVVQVKVANKELIAGPDVLSFKQGFSPIANVAEDWPFSDTYMALVMAALHYAGVKDRVDCLALGLPVAEYAKSKKPLQERFKDHIFVPAGLDGKVNVVRLSSVRVYPQPIGAFATLSKTATTGGQSLLVDVGQGTLDWLLLGENGLVNWNTSGSTRRGGVFSLAQRVADLIVKDLDIVVEDLGLLSRALYTPDIPFFNHRPIGMRPYMPHIDDAATAFLQGAIARVDHARVKSVFLVGGGAPLYKAAAQRIFGNRVAAPTIPAAAIEKNDMETHGSPFTTHQLDSQFD